MMTCLFALLLVAAPGPVAKLGLAPKPVDALGGRLTLRVPQGAVSEARGHSIMAADRPDENETRFVVDAENARIVVIVSDVFATASNGNLVPAARKNLAREKTNT